MFKFVAIAVLATVAIAQEDEAPVPTMEGCEMKTEEVLAEEDADVVGEACALACTPEELAGLDEEAQEEAAAEFTEEQTQAVVDCALNCAMCSNFGAAVEESASAVVMGATVAFAAAALF